MGDLRLAWAWTMEPGMQETTPLVRDGIMFLLRPATSSRQWMPAMELPSGNIGVSGSITQLHCPVPIAMRRSMATSFTSQPATPIWWPECPDGEVSWERQIGDWTIGQHYSGGPQILDGKVVVGMSGCYYINTGCWITHTTRDWRGDLANQHGAENRGAGR